MKKLLYVFMALCLFISIANAALPGLRLHWEMDSADDFNLGEDIFGVTGRTYVTNSVTGAPGSGMIAGASVYFDPDQGALRMSGDIYSSQIYGWLSNDIGEDPNIIFTSETQYTFSLWAKGDLSAVSGNGYNFYVFWDANSNGIVDANDVKFKCDLGFLPEKAACFTAPANGDSASAYGIWDPNNTEIYVNPESWNMYTFTWNADSNQVASYVNGVLRGSCGDNDVNTIPAIPSGTPVLDFGFGDGYGWHGPGGWYRNYRIWDKALDANEVADLVGDFFLIAQAPLPGKFEDFITDTNTIDLTLSWQAGTYAASHDLYIGTDFNDVNDADNGSAVFKGNLANSNYGINLATGDTYYWRVDEINDIDLWRGDVWNFNIIKVPDPVLLYKMDSADDFNLGQDIGGHSGRTYVTNAANGELASGMTSTAGIVFDADESALYMNGVHPCRIEGRFEEIGNTSGAGEDDVNSIFSSSTQYTFSMFAKGDKSAVSGNGYGFYLFFDTTGDSIADTKFKCDLSWLPGNAASFTAPGSSWLNSAYHIWDPDPAYAYKYVDPETWNMYTFVWDADNQFIATYVNGIDRAHYAGGTAIAAGATVTDFGFGDGYGWAGPGGWFKDYRVYDTALNADAIQYILGDFLLYPKSPNPKNNTTGVALEGTVLTWTHGLGAVSQDVYFGQSESAVKNADILSPEYKGQIAVDTFDPNTLDLFKTYYWRVDQLDANSVLIVKGPVWNFSSIEAIMVEDFESYDEEGNSIGDVWTDKGGEGDMQIKLMNDPCLSPVNSMRLRYQIYYPPHYAIAARSFSPAQDWTVNGVKILTVHYYGDESNFGLPLFVTIGDANVVVTDVNTLAEGWNEINVSLLKIAEAGVDLNNVSYMEIGLGDGTNLGGMSSSQWDDLFIDDIALYPSKCVVSQSLLQADITEDCVVNYDDLDVFSDNWLLAGYTVSAAGSVSDDDLVLYYDFDGDAVDSVAGNNGTVQNLGSAASYEAGHDNNNQCIHFGAIDKYTGSNMIVPPAAFADVNEEVTFSFWLKKTEAAPLWYQALFAGHGVATGQCEIFLSYAPALATNMLTTFTAGSDGCIQWQSWDGISYTQEQPFDYTAWHHYAMVKNVKLGYMYIYADGELEVFRAGKVKPITGCDKFRLGSGAAIDDVDGNFSNSSIDNFRMYSRALTHAEVLTLAEQASVTVTLSELGVEDSDFNTDDAIDFKDYSILASEWLVEDLWP